MNTVGAETMERRQYINFPNVNRTDGEERRRDSQSGASKMYRLVGVSFGLLCIIQSALNVSFRLQTVGVGNMSAGDVMHSERDRLNELVDQLNQTNQQLVQDKNQLLQENQQLLKDKTQLNQENQQLNQDGKQLKQENQQLLKDKTQLNQENQQLNQENQQLLEDKTQLNQENQQLLKDKTQLNQENQQLLKDKKQLNQENQQLLEDKTQLNQDRDRLILEKLRLLKGEEQLNQTNQKLVQGKNKLEKEKRHLQVTNRNLQETVIQLQNQINTLQTNVESEICLRCPQGWKTYGSSCYQLSSWSDTWENAKQDCERKEAHLVIFNDHEEEEVVRNFGAVKMWMGLYRFYSKWTWMDGYELSPESHWKLEGRCWSRGCMCAYVDGSNSYSDAWNVENCQERHRWMCEKKKVFI